MFIGPEAEARFGRRHFMDLMAVFTAPPEFTVLHGREEIGRTDPVLLVDRVEGPRLLLLGGRSWRVTWTDWKRRRCFVEPAEGGGRARWLTAAVGGASFELARAMRDVLLGTDPPVALTRRAVSMLAGLRSDGIGRVRAATWSSVVQSVASRLVAPDIDEKALAGLKFSAALPRELATSTLAARLADFEHAALVLTEPVRFER